MMWHTDRGTFCVTAKLLVYPLYSTEILHSFFKTFDWLEFEL